MQKTAIQTVEVDSRLRGNPPLRLVLNDLTDTHEVGYDPDQARGAEQPAGRRDWMNDGMSRKSTHCPEVGGNYAMNPLQPVPSAATPVSRGRTRIPSSVWPSN